MRVRESVYDVWLVSCAVIVMVGACIVIIIVSLKAEAKPAAICSKYVGFCIERIIQESLVSSGTVNCNDFVDALFGPLSEQGSYIVKAILDVPSGKCGRCELRKAITIIPGNPFRIPDNSLLSFPLLLVIIILLHIMYKRE